MTHLSKSIVVNTGVEDVWAVFADYGAVDVWHPYFESVSLVPGSPASGVGAARDCSFGPRSSIRETVIEWSENAKMTIGIEFLSGPPMPIDELVAAVEVAPVGANAGQTNVELSLDYVTRWGPIGMIADRLAIRRLYTNVFRDMLAACKAYVETGAIPPQLALLGSGRKL